MKGNTKECPNDHTIALISHASKVMPQILQARVQLMWTKNFWIYKLDLKKGRRTRDQVANICWIIKKARELQKSIYFCFIEYAKSFDCVDQSKLWKVLKEMGIPDHLTCLLRNLYAGQEAAELDREQLNIQNTAWHLVLLLHGKRWWNNGNSD